jgi:hypothetical protein
VLLQSVYQITSSCFETTSGALKRRNFDGKVRYSDKITGVSITAGTFQWPEAKIPTFKIGVHVDTVVGLDRDLNFPALARPQDHLRLPSQPSSIDLHF